MKVAIVPELSDVYFRHIPNTLEALQAEVGGYIETVRLTTELLLIINEEGRLMDMPENQHLKGIVGPAVIVHNRAGDPEFHGCPMTKLPILKRYSGIKKPPQLRQQPRRYTRKISVYMIPSSATKVKSGVAVMRTNWTVRGMLSALFQRRFWNE